jgi:hypothetical protein
MRIVLGLLLALGACASDVENHLQDGSDALDDCDIRGAHEAFTRAYDADPNDARAALGFALTDLALLPEDPAVTAVLADVGFTAALDMQLLVFGPDGALARYARGDTCDSIDTFLEANVPYPPVADGTIDEIALIRPDMVVADVLAGAQTLEPRLGRIAGALITAAGGVTDPISVEGGCGLGTLTFQAPELLALAGLLETTRAAIALAGAYDWNIGVAALLGSTSEEIPALVDAFNDHLGHRVDAAAAAAAADRFIRAMQHVSAAAAASTEIGGPVEGGLFDWSLFPVTLATEIGSFADSLADAAAGTAALAGLSPALEVDLSSLLAAEVDFAAASSPIFAVGTDEFGNFVTTNTDVLAEVFRPVVDPAPWIDAAPEYTWSLGNELDVFDGDPVIQPARRYTDVFDCMSEML